MHRASSNVGHTISRIKTEHGLASITMLANKVSVWCLRSRFLFFLFFSLALIARNKFIACAWVALLAFEMLDSGILSVSPTVYVGGRRQSREKIISICWEATLNCCLRRLKTKFSFFRLSALRFTCHARWMRRCERTSKGNIAQAKVFLRWVNIMALKSPLMSWNCVGVVKWMRKTEEKWCHSCWSCVQPQTDENEIDLLHICPNWWWNEGKANTMYGFSLSLTGKLQWDTQTHWWFLWFVIEKKKCVKGTSNG